MPQEFNSSYYYSLGSVGQSKTSTLVVEGNFYLTKKGHFWIYTNTEEQDSNEELTSQQTNGTEPMLLKDYINTLTKIWSNNVDYTSYSKKVSIGTNSIPSEPFSLLVNGDSDLKGNVQITDKLTLLSSIDFTNSSNITIVNNNTNAFSIKNSNSEMIRFDTTNNKIICSSDINISGIANHNSISIGNGYNTNGATLYSNGDIKTNGNIEIRNIFINVAIKPASSLTEYPAPTT